MKRLAYCSIAAAVLVFTLTGFLFPSAPASAENEKSFPAIRPMVFVHGSSGSGAQFESQAMRFTSNGYPASYIAVHEYNSVVAAYNRAAIAAGTLTEATCTQCQERYAALDGIIDRLLAETGADKVELLGHSLGTTEMIAYLESSPERAARIAHYVNIDGRTRDSLPGGVPTLAIWAGTGTPGRAIVGATNVTIPGVTHVEAATCPQAFLEMFRFFTGVDPETTHIVPEPRGSVRLAGRVLLFPENAAPQNATLEIYEVDGASGARIHEKPEAVYAIGGDGTWGPFKAKGGEHYEFVIVREGAADHHLYPEPFIRSDYLIRLNTSPPGGGVAAYMDTSDHQSNLVIIRYKELWGDQGINNDILAINGVNVVNAAICPIAKRVTSIFAYDKGADGVSDLSQPIAYYAALSFLTGVDLYVPGANPPDGTISLVLTPRGGGGKQQVINIPNRASSSDRISVMFNDFVQ